MPVWNIGTDQPGPELRSGGVPGHNVIFVSEYMVCVRLCAGACVRLFAFVCVCSLCVCMCMCCVE